MEAKTCKKCGGEKALDSFRVSLNTSDGREGKCRECRTTEDQQRRSKLKANRPPALAEKRCTKCDEVKPMVRFHRKASELDGFCSWCKECHTALPSRSTGFRQEERRRAAEAKGRMYATAAEVLARGEERRAKREAEEEFRRAPRSHIIEDHPDREKARQYRNALYRARYERQGDTERARVRRYKHSNPHRVARWGQRRWKRIAQQHDGSLTSRQVERLYSEATACPYCGTKMDEGSKHLDHMDPVSLGGVHGLSNAVVCCGSCNLAKSARPFRDWLAMLEEPHRTRALSLYTRLHGAPPEQTGLPLFA